MKEFLSIFKIICYIILFLEIFLWGFLSLYAFDIVAIDYSIATFVMFLSFMFLSILFFKNNSKKTINRKFIYKITCLYIFMIIFYIFFMVPEVGIDGIVFILIPVLLIYIYIFFLSYKKIKI